VYKNQNKLDEAIRDFSKAIEIYPTETLNYLNRGLVYMMQSKFDKAILDFSKTI
jgi:tetratricopeptide (TPR) repeat protein